MGLIMAVAASVLLIIAGAVVGPIEGEWKEGVRHPSGYGTCIWASPFCTSVHTNRRDGIGSDHCGATSEDYEKYPLCLKAERETTAETCARAMKDIGASGVGPVNFSMFENFADLAALKVARVIPSIVFLHGKKGSNTEWGRLPPITRAKNASDSRISIVAI